MTNDVSRMVDVCEAFAERGCVPIYLSASEIQGLIEDVRKTLEGVEEKLFNAMAGCVFKRDGKYHAHPGLDDVYAAVKAYTDLCDKLSVASCIGSLPEVVGTEREG